MDLLEGSQPAATEPHPPVESVHWLHCQKEVCGSTKLCICCVGFYFFKNNVFVGFFFFFLPRKGVIGSDSVRCEKSSPVYLPGHEKGQW